MLTFFINMKSDFPKRKKDAMNKIKRTVCNLLDELNLDYYDNRSEYDDKNKWEDGKPFRNDDYDYRIDILYDKENKNIDWALAHDNQNISSYKRWRGNRKSTDKLLKISVDVFLRKQLDRLIFTDKCEQERKEKPEYPRLNVKDLNFTLDTHLVDEYQEHIKKEEKLRPFQLEYDKKFSDYNDLNKIKGRNDMQPSVDNKSDSEAPADDNLYSPLVIYLDCRGDLPDDISEQFTRLVAQIKESLFFIGIGDANVISIELFEQDDISKEIEKFVSNGVKYFVRAMFIPKRTAKKGVGSYFELNVESGDYRTLYNGCIYEFFDMHKYNFVRDEYAHEVMLIIRGLVEKYRQDVEPEHIGIFETPPIGFHVIDGTPNNHYIGYVEKKIIGLNRFCDIFAFRKANSNDWYNKDGGKGGIANVSPGFNSLEGLRDYWKKLLDSDYIIPGVDDEKSVEEKSVGCSIYTDSQFTQNRITDVKSIIDNTIKEIKSIVEPYDKWLKVAMLTRAIEDIEKPAGKTGSVPRREGMSRNPVIDFDDDGNPFPYKYFKREDIYKMDISDVPDSSPSNKPYP